MSEDRIASLPFWKGKARLSPLSGGITNCNFLVEDDSGRFVARLSEERPLLGIDRRNELLCQRTAAAIGLAPAVVYHENGVLVSEFIEGRTFSDDDVREAANLSRVAATLKSLHGAWDSLEGEMLWFSPFQTVRTYAASARHIGASLPDDIDELLEGVRQLNREMAPFRPALCHNDVLAANILDDGEQLWLIDWEYGGIGHPLFDLSGVSGNCSLDAAQEHALLEAYLGTVDESVLRDTRILKTVSLLREALWAVIQSVASEIEFDYDKYAADNFSAYQKAKAELTSSP